MMRVFIVTYQLRRFHDSRPVVEALQKVGEWCHYFDSAWLIQTNWTADDIYTAKFCFHETPTSVTASLRFSGDQLLYDAEYNVAFGPTKQPQLIGRSE